MTTYATDRLSPCVYVLVKYIHTGWKVLNCVVVQQEGVWAIKDFVVIGKK